MNYSEIGFGFVASVFGGGVVWFLAGVFGAEGETIKWIVAAVGFIVAFCIFALGSKCESCGKLCIGVSIASNRVRGVRCALCMDENMAELSRRHNDANMLALGGRLLDVEKAKRIMES